MSRELWPGRSHEAIVDIRARREVPVDWVKVEVVGEERSTVGSGKSSHTSRRPVVSLGVKLCAARTLPEGTTRLPFRFDLPEGLPPSYRGARAAVQYFARVRASIPWWPDAQGAFELFVMSDDWAERADEPLVFSTAPHGPKAEEAYAEGSLDSTVFHPGGVVSGAIALGNVRWNRYRSLDVGVVGVETRLSRSRPERGDAFRYTISIPVDAAVEGEPIPFSFKLPDDVRPSYQSALWSLDWHFDARARIRLAADLRLRVPVTVGRPVEGAQPTRRFRAPRAIIGSERIEGIWKGVGAELGLAYDEGRLIGRRGAVDVEVRREHRGRDGVFLLAELHYPSLRLGLDIEPARGLRRVIAGGYDIGDAPWARRHRVQGRDAGQILALVTLLRERLELFGAVTMDDERAVATLRGAGQRPGKLRAFCEAALDLASSVLPAAEAVPPPASMLDGVRAWEELARRLGVRLETARMAVVGTHGGVPAAICTEWAPEGQPLRTAVSIEPAIAIPKEVTTLLLWSSESAEGDVERWTAATPAARSAATALLEGARSLHVAEDRLVLSLDAPILDPLPLLGKLSELGRLAMLLRRESGPFR